ncbi:MAG: (2Fe-2S)-binding protein [Candidatus Marinimicrobia bacterium]|nr:(2Fe-2S)-binding protein [Candidatus Neomarinimicrobiota bacterium]
MAYDLVINGKNHTVEVEGEMPLLWVLRDELGLTGTKYGCGIAACGACTVHIDGRAARSCNLPVAAVTKPVTTIEGLSNDSSHPVQQAWVKKQVPQCGYCQPGMIMAVSALFAKTPNPKEDELKQTISNVCRCGTYDRVREAVASLVEV